jgi:hypothetical protein
MLLNIGKWKVNQNHLYTNVNKTLGILKNTFRFRRVHMWKKIYKTYVRRHFEFAISVWNPYSTCDIVKLWKIQPRATKITHRTIGFNFNKRLKIFNFTNLATWRNRGDIIQIYIKNRLYKRESHTGRFTSSSRA